MIRDTQQQASQEFIADLKGAVSDAYFDRMTRLLYSTDAKSLCGMESLFCRAAVAAAWLVKL